MEDELFDLVQRAQGGDNEALSKIITAFLPTIRCARQKIKKDRQDDLEQNIVETIIKKIMSYDLTQTPDFSTYCRQINQQHDPSNQTQLHRISQEKGGK
ncbi:hypothetical protein BVG16_25665 [Paenibacillus selenitireducens]|uniref:Helix-turn-helix conjugative transposon-like domain-containing protein n=1 Tax=Paenibacillus selenitireducens TaxID=1324314 RepID=A0A1T2X2S0_9BACL|nr:helix-turn-helix domain-containing protein [Paenibacillus selenitireducens]OPA74137.1 hypothetical protein BVG16_25665 [Paenibacillus selenitireducens]